MINFNEEIKKYKPILEVANIEQSTKENEMEDMLDLLQHIASKADKGESQTKE